MARLLSCGFELGGDPAAEDAALTKTITTFAAVTTPVRSGGFALHLTAATQNRLAYAFTGVLANKYFARVAFRCSTAFTANANVIGWIRDDASGQGAMIGYKSGVLTLQNRSAGTVVLTGPTMNLNQWYVVEWSWIPTSGACELKVDGVSYGTGTTADKGTSTTMTAALLESLDSSSVYFDDWALNDNTGTAQNSWCGLGQIIMLLPTADSATTGYTAGAGGTTALWDAVNNRPPVGVANASATNTSQIKDGTASTTDNYQPTMQTPTAAGLPAGAIPVLAQGVTSHSSTGSISNGIRVVSNPVIAEVTATASASAAGTWPTNWSTLKTAVSYSPVIAPATAPVMEFRKNTASTLVSFSAFIGLMIEYLPPPPQLIVRRRGAVTRAVRSVRGRF